MLRFLIKSVQNGPKTNPLGRWHRPTTKQSEDIKVLLANHDSCGDNLCGNPVNLKEQIEVILVNDDNDKVKSK